MNEGRGGGRRKAKRRKGGVTGKGGWKGKRGPLWYLNLLQLEKRNEQSLRYLKTDRPTREILLGHLPR